MDEVLVAKALSSKTRMQILRWLRNPESSFESKVEGDLTKDGVCVALIAEKAAISQPTASRHLSVLKEAGLLETVHVAQRRYHRRSEDGIDRAKQLLIESV